MCEGYLIGEPVTLQVRDREEGLTEDLGGGISSGAPKFVVVLLHMGSDWVVYQWERSRQIVIVPACDVLCIASDLPAERQENTSEKVAAAQQLGFLELA